MTCILVVDDQPDNRYMLEALLSAYGFSVLVAANGREALEKAEITVPDLVISDLLMPEMDGYTLLRRWRKDARFLRIPFVVYTATYTTEKDRVLALELGADDFILKPQEPDSFMERIERLIENKSYRLVHEPAAVDELSTYKHYSEVLIEKLEKKTEELSERIRDLSESRAHVRRLNRLYACLSATNQTIVHGKSEEELFTALCRIAVESGQFVCSWIGLLNKSSGEILPEAQFGEAAAWFEVTRPFSINHPPRVPAEMVCQTGRRYLSNDLMREPGLRLYHEALTQCGLKSAASMPLFKLGELVGAWTFIARELGYFDEDTMLLLEEMAGDVSFALDTFEGNRARAETLEQLRLSDEANRLSTRALEASANGILISSVKPDYYPIIYANPAFERITGYTEGEALGRDPAFLMKGDHDQPGLREVLAAIQDRRETQAILRCYQKDGNLFWNELTLAPVKEDSGRVSHFVGVLNDISERKRYEEQLERQYNEDALTGLASRNLLRDRTAQAIGYAVHQKKTVALLLIDLDGFKHINDSLGHSIGDVLLCQVAQRLLSSVRTLDTCAHLSGDEFAILLNDLSRPQYVLDVANNILEVLRKPMEAGERQFSITASIGIGVYPTDGSNFDTLLRNADTAMHHAKNAGRDTVRFYASNMNSQALQRLNLESQLRKALENREFRLYYQPMVSLITGKVTGAEALIRWQNPEGKLVSPAEFIPLAEETGLICAIGAWVIEEACRQMASWQMRLGLPLSVSVNLSARQFREENLVQRVRETLGSSGLAPGLLKVEITESALMEDAAKAAKTLIELKALGVKIAMDDFGTGYSSLAYLKQFPIDQLKIDRTFVKDVTQHEDSAIIARSVVGLANALKLETVGEGVETEAQRLFLTEAGCDLIQGYLFSPPLQADAFEAFMHQQQD